MVVRLRPPRSLRVRVPATAVAVFAVSLAVATLLAYQLLLQAGRADVDTVLDRERERFAQSMQALLAEGQDAASRDVPASQLLEDAARQYLRLNPANESYWTIIRLDSLDAPLSSTDGPDPLEPLFEAGRVPEGRAAAHETLDSPVGQIRSSSSPIVLAGEPAGTYQVVAPLEPIRQEALAAAGAVAAAAGVSLLLGAALLSATLWRSLSPLGSLARTARSTELRTLDARVDEPDGDDEVGTLAREFNLMLDRLAAASASQSAFMASVSHELRTPITIARGHLELLRSIDRDDPDALTSTVEVLEDELARMGRLVDDLLAVARAEMDGFVRPRDVELVAFFEELELKLAGLRLPAVRIEPPPPVVLQVDPDRLAQAVLNLVVNAQQHTPAGTTIRIQAHEEPGGLRVEVADDGPGIPEAIRAEVFEPFVRAGEVSSSTGLGLAVTRAVVRAHGGDVTYTTGPGGTTMALHLPVAAEDPAATTAPLPTLAHASDADGPSEVG